MNNNRSPLNGERRSTDKIHIDKTIPIYQIAVLLIAGISSLITLIIYQAGVDSNQNIEISKNASEISANKDARIDFQDNVIRSLKQINDRGDRSEAKQDEFVNILLDIYKELKDAKK